MKFLDVAMERAQEEWSSGFSSGRATIKKGFGL